MSLQVWLPLNGDLHNQGLADITVTNNGATVDSSGKIGKCYSFDGSDDYLYNSNISNTIVYNNNKFTICAWVYAISGNSYYPIFHIGKSGVTGICLHGSVCNRVEGGDGTNKLDSSTFKVLSYDTWTHVTIEYDGTNIIEYINGDFIKSIDYSYGFGTGNTILKVGGFWGTPFKGKINDFRIYDNCLSPKEVREISKALVLHYPLNQPERSPNLLTEVNKLSSWTQDGLTATQYTDSEKGSCLQLVYGSGSTRIYHSVSNVWNSGVIYTVSFDAKASTSVTLRMSRSLADYASSFTIGTTWKHYVGTITCTETATGGTLSVQTNTGTTYICNVKLENINNPNATFTPNSSDSPTWSDNIEYDTSGFCCNGTVTSSTAPTLAIDSPKYNFCYYFNGSKYIIGKNLTGSKSIDGLTLCCWINPSSVSSGNIISCYEGGGAGLHFSSSKIYFQIYGSSSGYISVASTSTLSTGTWYFICGTYNKTSLKIYVNGKYENQTSCTENISYNAATPWSICCNPSGTSDGGEHYSGYISDVRVYATALSADDIQELYNAPINISNNASLMTFGEINEC